MAKSNIRRFMSPTGSGEEIEVMEGCSEAKGRPDPPCCTSPAAPPALSTVLMLALPARIAGCREIVLATPPDKEGKIHPAILYAAELCGVMRLQGRRSSGDRALAFGTETIHRVDKIRAGEPL